MILRPKQVFIWLKPGHFETQTRLFWDSNYVILRPKPGISKAQARLFWDANKVIFRLKLGTSETRYLSGSDNVHVYVCHWNHIILRLKARYFWEPNQIILRLKQCHPERLKTHSHVCMSETETNNSETQIAQFWDSNHVILRPKPSTSETQTMVILKPSTSETQTK